MDWAGPAMILFPNQEKRGSQWEPHTKHRLISLNDGSWRQ
jgi:hypothetical protein